MKHTTMKLAKLLLVIILSSVGFCSYAQEDKNDEYVPVSVETYGVPASVIGQFEVLYYGSRVEQTSDGYYMCKKYDTHYSIAPWSADAYKPGYYEVYSNCSISRDLDRRIYFDEGADEENLEFPIEVFPDGYDSGNPIEIEVRITFVDE